MSQPCDSEAPALSWGPVLVRLTVTTGSKAREGYLGLRKAVGRIPS